jgi:hypothetical protein
MPEAGCSGKSLAYRNWWEVGGMLVAAMPVVGMPVVGMPVVGMPVVGMIDLSAFLHRHAVPVPGHDDEDAAIVITAMSPRSGRP